MKPLTFHDYAVQQEGAALVSSMLPWSEDVDRHEHVAWVDARTFGAMASRDATCSFHAVMQVEQHGPRAARPDGQIQMLDSSSLVVRRGLWFCFERRRGCGGRNEGPTRLAQTDKFNAYELVQYLC